MEYLKVFRTLIDVQPLNESFSIKLIFHTAFWNVCIEDLTKWVYCPS